MEREARPRSLPFMTSYARAQNLYALDMKEDDFIETAYSVWREIGNVARKPVRFFTKVPDDFIIELPPECDAIESVTLVNERVPATTYDSAGPKERRSPAQFTQMNVPGLNESLTTSPGQSVGYVTERGAVRITSSEALNRDIMIVYKSIVVDDDGLPLINDKESAAIAAEVARRMVVREAFQGVAGREKLLQFIMGEADRLMAAAKIDEIINDDAIDKMLDIKTTWDRKIYGHRFDLLK